MGFIILKKKGWLFLPGDTPWHSRGTGLTFRKMLAACVGRAMGDFCLSYMSTEEAILGGGGWMVEGEGWHPAHLENHPKTDVSSFFHHGHRKSAISRVVGPLR